MSPGRTTRGGLGGLGALFFLGTLGAIAIYVQRQSAPEDLDLPRTAATAAAQVPEPTAPPPLPWLDRLDLGAAKFNAYLTAATTTAPSAAKAPAPDGRLVQEFNDGHRILLTIDPVLQDAALQIFRNREVPFAAAVMLDVRDNSVLLMAGHSSMDPQVDPMEIVASAWAPAASVFKLVTSAALLESGNVTAGTQVCFSGGLHGITDDELRDVPARDTQCESLSTAVAHSYNLVLGKLALAHLGQDQLAQVAKTFLFETDIPFEFNIERSPAHIPSDPMERARVAAGFWSVDMSPMHGALLASIFARGGMVQSPHVIAQVLGPDGTDLTPALAKSERVISREVSDAIAAMMADTTTHGTARASFRDAQGNDYIQGMTVAGKTGSLTGKRAPSLNYNWFIGFAPADRPEIAFAVLLANGPAWRIKAHYAARRMVQLYMERRDAITRARDAKLTAGGVALPDRDVSGALVSGAVPTPSPSAKPRETGKPAVTETPVATANTEGVPDAPRAAAVAELPAVSDAEPALPPIPGSLSKPEAAPLGG